MPMLSHLQRAAFAAIALTPLGFGSVATAAPGSVVVPTVPVNGQPSVVLPPLPRPNAPAIVVPIYSPGNPSTRIPPVTTPGRLPPVPAVKPPVYGGSSPVTQPIGSSTAYRVIVASSSDVVQQRVKTLVPQAFRTSVNGQSVIQAGIFREQGKAVELQQLLNRNNLSATILSGQVTQFPVPTPGNTGSTPLPSVPKSGRIVVIDPGHGGGDPGAIGIGGIRESEITLDISRQVVSLLKQQGIEAVLTRSRDEEIDLEPRVDFAERANADIFVSIHANSFDANRTDVSGIETYYYANGSGQQLARLVQNSLLQELGARDRGVRTANFYVIKYTSMPAILVETGFVTGSEDAARFAKATGRTQIARAIARGILQYMRS